jgi:hypothetical protein
MVLGNIAGAEELLSGTGDEEMDLNFIKLNMSKEETADCMRKGLCFLCKQAKHIMRDCPMKKKKPNF